eukprot:NP_001040720.1 Uncharacterized protein CELE_ZK1053.7 [Caenorhabditis elegans]
MSSEDPIYSQNESLLLGSSNKSQASNSSKTIAKRATVFIGILFITTPIVFGLSEVVGKNNEESSPKNQTSETTTAENNTTLVHRTSFKTQEKMVQLIPKSGQDYIKFTYDIIKDTYSYDNVDGTPISCTYYPLNGYVESEKEIESLNMNFFTSQRC